MLYLLEEWRRSVAPADGEIVIDIERIEEAAGDEIGEVGEPLGLEVPAGICGGDDCAGQRKCSHVFDID